MGVILGISASAGAGKDTVADMLVNNHSFCKISFADPIKRSCRDWWDFSYEQLWGSSEKRNEPDLRYLTEIWNDDEDIYLSPRMALIEIGTAIGRKLDPDVWIRYALKTARVILQSPAMVDYYPDQGLKRRTSPREKPIVGVVISDCRFNNELFKIQDEGGKIIRVKNPRNKVPEEFANHRSETEHLLWEDDEFDYCLNNNGTLTDLQEKVRIMVEDLLGPQVNSSKQLELFK